MKILPDVEQTPITKLTVEFGLTGGRQDVVEKIGLTQVETTLITRRHYTNTCTQGLYSDWRGSWTMRKTHNTAGICVINSNQDADYKISKAGGRVV